VQILPGVHVTFLDAGHMLGSAIVVLNMEDRDNNRETTLIFSGDIGRPGLPILRDPSRVDRADVLIMESTYGDRVHEPFEDSSRKFAAIINETYRRGGKIIIPSFAVGRTQELIYAVNQLVQTKKVPPIPVFIDSPLAIDVTAVFMQHPEAYDAETRAFMAEQGGMRDPFGFAGLKYTRTREQSMELNFMRQPAIIISASGMAETGRIQHHLKNNIEDPDNTVLIVGYQAENTLGRRIQEKADKVKIFGEWYDLRARVETLSGFSAHADRNDLLNWAGAIKKKPLQTFLVHGEIGPMQALKQALHDELGFERVEAPELHQSFEV
jgi:metallo-beta-lactamase family protein